MSRLYRQLAVMLPYSNFMSSEYELQSKTESATINIAAEDGDLLVMEDDVTEIIMETANVTKTKKTRAKVQRTKVQS